MADRKPKPAARLKAAARGRRSGKPGPRRRSAALSAELDAFLTEVVDALAACMAAHRWEDLPAAMKAYARSAGILDPGRLFHASIAHKVLRHVLTLQDRGQLEPCIIGLYGSLEALRSGQSLDVAVAQHRKILEIRESFEELTSTNASEVH